MATSYAAPTGQERQTPFQGSSVPSKAQYVQDPIAVVGLACRLPGDNNTPTALWDFLERGGCAAVRPPDSRFRLQGHYDASKKPKTMASPGGMFLESIDPQDVDAPFFKLSKVEAISMDPQQRQLLEVVYEGLENAGISLEALAGQAFGCFVGSYASDYTDVLSRDPENRAPACTIGIGRAMLSNRISHFLNIKGPSMTIDTGCSGSLVGLDIASRYLQTGEIRGAIVAGCNIYLSPEHTMDLIAAGGTASPSGKCHTFDIKADGYIKSEAVNMVILKRLDDAIRDGDPIRAIIRGSATNSDGWTAGIASPSSKAQAAAIRQAYMNANISDLSATTYLECHGTGTQAGDPTEVAGIASVFAATRLADEPLRIGSIKSNIGHSEPAAGISGLLKVILALEKGLLPGNPTFETPNPKIDFDALRVRATKATVRWPDRPFRRASVNSFGYGGSNVHVIVDEANGFLNRVAGRHVSSYLSNDDDPFADERPEKLCTLVFSANDEQSLRSYCKALNRHLVNPGVRVKLRDLAYTLSERRTRHFHRAYVVTPNCNLDESSVVFGKVGPNPPRVGFVFTGQGAQWSQMGKGVVATFPAAKLLLKRLDEVLHNLSDPPTWSLLEELVEPRTAEHLRLPEFSQPLVTALQLVMLAVLDSWGVRCQSVVGHSSGEIAAAVAAGYLTPEEAIRVAYYRGKAAFNLRDTFKTAVGMLAVGLGSDAAQGYLSGEDSVEIACINSPNSVTLSGTVARLDELKTAIQHDGHFARLLLVDLAYHSSYMTDIATHYGDLLVGNCELPSPTQNDVAMFSSITGRRIDDVCDANYWTRNMVSPVLFGQAIQAMVSEPAGADFLIEIGPSGALAGPIAQIGKSLTSQGASFEYVSACKRGSDAVKAMFEVAGRLFIRGGAVDMIQVNKDDEDSTQASVIIDLPNYAWNHSTKYWHESEASKDWRFRRYVQHDLLGSKVLGTSWNAPSWRNTLRVQDLPWLQDHKVSKIHEMLRRTMLTVHRGGQLRHDIVFPAAGYIAMAIEALFQKSQSTGRLGEETQNHEVCYRLRNVKFTRAMVLEEQAAERKVMLVLTSYYEAEGSWHEFTVSSLAEGVSHEHCRGLICLGEDSREVGTETDLQPLKRSTPAQLWYKAMRDIGYDFGPHFQKQMEVESLSGVRRNRTLLSFSEPRSTFKQSAYPMHPVCIDGGFQSAAPSLWQGHRSSIDTVLVPAMIDEITIKSRSSYSETGIAVASAEYIGVGRLEEIRNYRSQASVYDSKDGSLLLRLSGLRYHKLDSRESVHAAHTYTRFTWKPDISLISRPQLLALINDEGNTKSRQDGSDPLAKINKVIDLVAHKTPNLRVIEINTVDRSDSIWLDGAVSDPSSRAACRQYHIAASTTDTLLDTQEKYGADGNVDFSILDLTDLSLDVKSNERSFDLVIVKLSMTSKVKLTDLVNNARRLVCDTGYVLVLNHGFTGSNPIVDPVCPFPLDSVQALYSGGSQDPAPISNTEQTLDVLGSGYLTFDTPQDVRLPIFDRHINLVHFGSDNEETISVAKEALANYGWQITDHFLPFSSIQPDSTVIVLDELHSPVLQTITTEQWDGLQHLIHRNSKILWVTTGSQLEVTRPDNALIHGLARTLRAEDPSLVIMTLDVGSSSSAGALATIHRILEQIKAPQRSTQIESEFVERHGIVHISRLLPDTPLNQAERDHTFGAKLRLQSLHDHKSCVRLISQRVGTLGSLHYTEVSTDEIPLEDGFVEVDIHAASLNFKDVAVAMGLVPADEHRLGLDGAGVIRRVGRYVSSVKVGQRVVVHRKGSFANRVQSPEEGVHSLPDSMSFEDAATLPCVYLVSIYGLIDLAHTQRGQSVLIHSAAGGVGIAAIQVCQYLGAELYVTVGTDEKRKFLIETFGIPSERIFNSRSIGFAPMLMSATNGKGVDVILNSLSGKMLDETWRCIAERGTFLEIGKKDMLDRNYLSMEPFCRGASYKAIDMSHDSIPLATIARLLSQTLKLISQGHIKPIFPRRVFSFGDIVGAFRYMRSGSHIGKIVILDGPERNIQVPIQPGTPMLRFRSDVSFLIVGGLKGLCGSLAIFMARQGAKHLVIMSRSGYKDEKSKIVIANLEALGTQVHLVQGDVASLQDVQKAFRNSTKPVAGVIQGAMVLQDKTFASMTAKEFHGAIQPKVHGTWNLHNVALEQNVSLDFFTMLSSISGLIGQKSQANYASANVFLDSFAAYRRELGLAACSVDLGLIEDVGYISEHEALAKRLDTSVWTGINEGLLHKILRFSILQQTSPINQDSASQMIAGIQVPQKEDAFMMRDARFAGLCFRSSDPAATDSQDSSKDVPALLTLLKGKVDRSILLAAAIKLVNAQFMKILGLIEPMEPAKTLSGYGIDSLAAVEFRNWVRLKLSAEMTVLEIINAKTLSSLCESIITKISPA